MGSGSQGQWSVGTEEEKLGANTCQLRFDLLVLGGSLRVLPQAEEFVPFLLQPLRIAASR